jgi:hypothetical protein
MPSPRRQFAPTSALKANQCSVHSTVGGPKARSDLSQRSASRRRNARSIGHLRAAALLHWESQPDVTALNGAVPRRRSISDPVNEGENPGRHVAPLLRKSSCLASLPV